jgi:hypothetical protein
MGAIRIETDGTGGMDRVYSWLARHRGQVIDLGAEQKVMLGVPISGARAVIIAAVLSNGVGGVLRALTNLTGSVRLVFDIRSRAGLDADQVRAIGTDALDSIARLMAEENLVTQVA